MAEQSVVVMAEQGDMAGFCLRHIVFGMPEELLSNLCKMLPYKDRDRHSRDSNGGVLSSTSPVATRTQNRSVQAACGNASSLQGSMTYKWLCSGWKMLSFVYVLISAKDQSPLLS